jgi:hypothetical protein
VVCLGPRGPGEIVGPWPLSDVGAWPLNFTVRRPRLGSRPHEEIMSMTIRHSGIHTLVEGVLFLQGISMLFDASAAAQTLQPASWDAQEVIALEKRAWDLWKAGNKTGFAALLTNDFVSVDAHGISTKADNVKEIDNLIKHTYRLWDVEARLIGMDVILLTYKAHLNGAYKGSPVDEDLYASSEWVKRGGTWLNVFYHETVAAK